MSSQSRYFGYLRVLVVWLLILEGCSVDSRIVGIGDAGPGRSMDSTVDGGSLPAADSSPGGDARIETGAADASLEGAGPVTFDAGTSCTGPDSGPGCGGGEIEGGTGMPLPPLLVLEPDAKDFSSVVTGFYAEAAFQVSNTGDSATSAPAIDIDGTDAALFSISGNTCTGPVPADGSCVVTIRFSPTTLGPKSARVNVMATLGGATIASLQGIGVAPGALTITPANPSLGSILVGTQSAPVTLTVTNTGGTPTGTLLASVVGSAEFAITTDGCSGKSILGGEVCTLTVLFAPTGAAQKSATLVVSSTPGGTVSAGLTGVGLGPAALSIRPATAVYVSTVVGATSAAQTFTVTNTGGAAAGTTTALATAPGGNNAADFTIASSTCTGMLAAGASCVVTAAFKPIATGSRAGTITVSGAPGGSASAALTGAGLSVASLTLAPAAGSSADFGTVVVGSSAPQTFVVTNPGEQSTTAILVAVTGAGFAVSTPTTGDCVSGTTVLGPGETCSIHVRLTPAAAGTPAGTLTASAATGGSAMLTLGGTAVTQGTLTVSPPSQIFSPLLPGARSTPVSFAVTNTGGAATGAPSAIIAGSTDFAISTNGCSTPLAAGGTCAIGVTFAPASSGHKTGSLSVSAAPGGTVSADLSGDAQSPASLSLVPTSFTFDNTVVGAASAAQSFTVTNSGDVPAGTSTALTSLIGGTNAADFSVSASTCTPVLAAKTTCTVSVVFRPTSASSRAGSLTVSASPGTAPTATLLGTGLTPAALSLAPATGSSASFGPLLLGSPRNQTFVVSNTGQQRSGAVRIGLTGADFAVITPASTDCAATTALDPGATCTVRVSFTPAAAGDRSATLTASATPGTSASLTLTGTGQAPSSLTISPVSQSFGSIVAGGSSQPPVTFTVTNNGDVASGTLATAITADFAIVTNGCSGSALAAHGTCAITATFNPRTAGAKTGTLSATPGGGASVSSALSGVGLAPAAFSISPATFAFPPTATGASSSHTFTVTNTGGVPAGGTTALAAAISGSTEFQATESCTTLAPGASCSVVVTLSPASVGAKSATLTVTGTPGGSATASLTGTGKLPTGTIVEFSVPPSEDSAMIGLIVGPDNNLWFSQDNVFRMNLSGTLLLPPFAPPGALGGGWLAAGPDGNVWVTENTDLSTGNIGIMTTTGASFPILTIAGIPRGITTGPDRNIWFANATSNAIGRVTVASKAITQFPILTAGGAPVFIVSGPDGALWFTEFTGNRIGRITTAGVVTEQPIPTAASMPSGIASGADGNIWFAERGGNKIGRRSIASGVITEFTAPTALPAGGIGPIGIASGSDGNIWFTEYSNSKIGRLEISTGLITEFNTPTASSFPNDIVAGPDGNLWFIEQGANNVGRISP